jgi:hypothetical protein
MKSIHPSILALIAIFASSFIQEGFAQKQGQVFQPVTASYQEDAGDVNVAIIGVRHLDDVIGELQPTFEINEKVALERSIPITLSYYNEAISSFKAALKIALPSSSTTFTETKTRIETNTTSTSTETENKIPGDLSKVTQENADHPALRDGKVPDGGLGTEALTQYQVAKTLFQAIKLMNRSLKDMPRSDIYEPYVLTLQISLMPYKRNMPYDAYGTLSFFPGGTLSSVPTNLVAAVKELLNDLEAKTVTDEVRLKTRLESINKIRQNAEATIRLTPLVGGMVFPKVIGAQAMSFSQTLQSKNGGTNSIQSDFNEIRLKSIASLEIYLAELVEEQEADRIRAQVPEQPIIIPLLATDNLEAADNDRVLNQIRGLNLALAGMFNGIGASAGGDWFKQNLESVNGRDLNGLMTLGRLNENTLRVRLGAMLQSKSEFAMVPRTHNVAIVVMVPKGFSGLSVFSRTVFRNAITGKELCRRKDAVIAKRFEEVIHRYAPKAKICENTMTPMLRAIMLQDTSAFHSNLLSICSNLTNFSGVVWLELSELYLGSQYGLTQVTVPPKPKFKSPGLQTLLAVDDGAATTAMIKGGAFPSLKGIAATLEYDGSIILPADTIELLTGGSGLRIKFPSLLQNNIREKPGQAPFAVTDAKLIFNLTIPIPDGVNNQTKISYTNSRILFKGEEKTPSPIVVVATAGYLVAGDAAARKYSMVLKKNKDAEGAYFVRVEGPVVKTFAFAGADIKRDSDGTFPVPGDGEAAFEFDYLLPYSDVNFVLLKKGADGNKSVLEVIKKERVAAIAAYPAGKQSNN